MAKIKAEQSLWQPLSGVQEPQVIRQFDGVNELNLHAIKDEQATRNLNLSTGHYPALATREGSTSAANNPLKTGGFNIWGMGTSGGGVYPGANNDYVHLVGNSSYYTVLGPASSGGGSWTKLTTPAISTTSRWSFVSFKGNYSSNTMLSCDGNGNCYKTSSSVTLAALPNAPAGANFITAHDNRVYIATDDTIYFSALRKAEDWSTVNDSGSIVIETTDGKAISGIVAGSQRLTVFKQNSIHELFGTNPSNYQMKLVTENLGSPTGFTAQVIDGAIYFLGSDERIYQYSGGALPNAEFSLPVKETLGKITKGFEWTSVSWVNGRKYCLAIPVGTINPNTVLEYDIDFNTWNIHKYSTDIMAATSADGYAHVGFVGGELLRLDGGTGADGATPISYEWVSKPFDFGTMAAKSRWYRMWVVADIPTGSTFNVYVSGEDRGESWTLVQSLSPNTNLQAQEIRIPTNLIANNNTVRIRIAGTGQVTVYEVSRQARVFPMGVM